MEQTYGIWGQRRLVVFEGASQRIAGRYAAIPEMVASLIFHNVKRDSSDLIKG